MVAAKHHQIAERLAARAYTIEFLRDRTVDGKKTVVVATSPELPGCIAQGATEEEAARELQVARIDYISSLLESGLPVPEPRSSGGKRQSPSA